MAGLPLVGGLCGVRRVLRIHCLARIQTGGADGELARLKPDPRHLTLFYLMVSIGGAVGGIFVGLIAPRVFSGYYELPLALVATAALIVSVLRRDLLAGGDWAPAWLAAVICVLGLAGYVG